MMQVVTASSRGQIVIPKEIRKRLNIVAGKRLSVKAEGDRVLLTPLPDDPVEAFCGIFEENSSLTRALAEQREKDKHREEKKIVG
ncbi:MAG: AbrB/MazE/SpoVT family DNA-binding domain-containing protein [Deltaproteobacteria bacterium]|nr:AbrB/MazE/SpoVT family DNA-binding domain-containing protein [Deltaproteobacteria bacterium]